MWLLSARHQVGVHVYLCYLCSPCIICVFTSRDDISIGKSRGQSVTMLNDHNQPEGICYMVLFVC